MSGGRWGSQREHATRSTDKLVTSKILSVLYVYLKDSFFHLFQSSCRHPSRQAGRLWFEGKRTSPPLKRGRTVSSWAACPKLASGSECKSLGTGPPSCEEKAEKIHLLFSENGPHSDSEASILMFPGPPPPPLGPVLAGKREYRYIYVYIYILDR